jgi:outer membrane receptor protein involved in Fe transport
MKIRIQKLIVLFFMATSGFSQNENRFTLVGEIKDSLTRTHIPYATISVLDTNTKRVHAGTISDEDGRFHLEVNLSNFYVEVSYIGFETQKFTKLSPSQNKIDLRTIFLKENSEQLEVVNVRAEKSRTQFKLDRKVFNVGKDIASTGMSALEVLNNVPSVNVNIEGEVSLRGSTGVQILIDGKPSVLADDSSNALGTITAEMIESVEVITNPSAKYDAEGTAGVLNIILKKEERRGINGSVSLNTGTPDNHSVGVSLNKRTEKFNLFTQFGAGYRSLPRDNENINKNKNSNTELLSEGYAYRNEIFYNLILGTDYHINDRNVLTLTGNYAFEIEDQPSKIYYQDYNNTVLENKWNRTGDTEATNPKWQYDLNYKKEFRNNKEHTLLISALGRFFGKELTSEFLNSTTFGANNDKDQQIETNFQQADYTFKLDYTNPVSKRFSIEAGSQYVVNDVGNDYEVRDNSGMEFIVNPDFTNNFEYVQKVLAFYGTTSYEINKWGLKLGLRIENTDVSTFLTNTQTANSDIYTDFFPSVHTSYKINDGFSVQSGYSSRIYRPRLWHLNPFFNIQDNYNIRTGNPNLLPEYTDSYEFTGVYEFDNISLSSSVYHKKTRDVMERIAVFDDTTTTSTLFNLGSRKTTGIEVNGKYAPLNWLSMNGDFNAYQFDRKGTYKNQNFGFSGKRWSSRLTTKIQFPLDLDFEITGTYNSSYKTVQGQMAGFGFADIGFRKKIFEGKGVLNISVRDVFASRVRERVIDSDTTYQYSFSQRGRFVALGFSYGFGKGEAMSYSGGRR